MLLGELIGPRFFRREPRVRALAYVKALLSQVETRNGWTVAEAAGEKTPTGMQRLLNDAVWDEAGVREDLRSYVVTHLGANDGVLVFDETGDIKQGNHTVGVARQYTGVTGLWGPESRLTSCDLLILVEQSAEPVAPLDGVRVARCPLGEWSEGSGLPEGAVWPVVVVVLGVLGQHGCGMPLVDDQEAVEEFAADRPDEAFGGRIGPRCPHRRLDDPDVDGGEDGVEGGGEPAVSVSDEEPEAAVGVIEVHQQIAGELGEPGAGRMGGDAEDVHPAGGVLDDEERVEPVQGDRVDVE